MKDLQEKAIGATGSLSGAASILGSWQICHNVCLGLIALLAAIGITLTGMPLIFLTKVAVPLWSLAVVLLIITIGFYVKKKCISKNWIITNSGLIIAGVPFSFIQSFVMFFWIIGGLIAVTGITLFIKEKRKKKCCKGEKK